jgi:hypothetical protein
MHESKAAKYVFVDQAFSNGAPKCAIGVLKLALSCDMILTLFLNFVFKPISVSEMREGQPNL